MLQGVMKHLIGWLVRIFGPQEINARCRAMPPNHKTLLFTKGITTLSRVTGHEHKKMCCILLGLIVDLPIPGGLDPSRIVKAVRTLLDFLYLAQYECHTSNTIQQLQECLSMFHDNKTVFVELGIRKHFDIPKFHSLTHYTSSIKLFGSTDNYNTEQSERLHIDFTKDAYRATNHKDEYPQMTRWLERREKIQWHTAFLSWTQQRNQQQHPQFRKPIGPPRAFSQSIKIAQTPSIKAASFEVLARIRTATHAADTLIPFRAVPVFHHVKFMNSESGNGEIVDAVHIRPEQKDSCGRIIPSRFDTVFVRIKGNDERRIAQVRVVFQIPHRVIDQVSSLLDTTPPTYLAYVEWFTPLPSTPDPKHLMYRVSRSTQNGCRNLGRVSLMYEDPISIDDKAGTGNIGGYGRILPPCSMDLLAWCKCNGRDCASVGYSKGSCPAFFLAVTDKTYPDFVGKFAGEDVVGNRIPPITPPHVWSFVVHPELRLELVGVVEDWRDPIRVLLDDPRTCIHISDIKANGH
ncbi:hypothetical protein BJV77DRAFT_1090480 [Russula vinacea]|nr:hypothetical protein BJV77DRAFT_1090480 [Russula vinacea]